MIKNELLAIVILVFVVAILLGCNTPKHTDHTIITQDEAMYMMANQDVIILDVRTLSEFNLGHIPGAISLELNEIRYVALYVIPDVNKTILVYCRSGARSAYASAILTEMGYHNVYDFGGIINWTGEIQN